MENRKGVVEFDSELLEKKKKYSLSLISVEIRRKIENFILSHKEYTI